MGQRAVRVLSLIAPALLWLLLCACPNRTGSIRAISEPEGAAVWLDGVSANALTNCILSDLAPGNYSVKLKLEGFADKVRTVEVRSGETSSVYGWFRLARGWTRAFATGGEGTDEARAVRQTADDGCLVAGNKSGHLGSHIVLAKLDADGAVLERWALSSSAAFLCARALDLTPDNNCIIAGASRPAWDSMDLLLIKATRDGATLWSKACDWSRYDVANCVLANSDGGSVITGWTGSFSSSGHSLWMLKLAANGDTLWTRSYGTDAGGYSVQATSDSGYVAAGRDTLAALDVSIPAHPTVLSRLALPGAGDVNTCGIACLAATPNLLFLARWRTNPYATGIYLFDITNRAQPVLLDSLAWSGLSRPTCAQFMSNYIFYGNEWGVVTLWLGSGRSQLVPFDSFDIYGQYSGGRHPGASAVSALEVSGNYLIAACRCSVQVAVLDASEPRQLSLVSSTADDATPDGQVDGLAVSGDFYYTAVEGQSFLAYQLPTAR